MLALPPKTRFVRVRLAVRSTTQGQGEPCPYIEGNYWFPSPLGEMTM